MKSLRKSPTHSLAERKKVAHRALVSHIRTRHGKPGFSAQQVAKSLGVSPALLSLVLSGQRSLSTDLLLRLESFLSIGSDPLPIAKSESKRKTRYASPEFSRLPSEVISYTWLDFAAADLLTLRGARPDVRWMANALGSTPAEISDAIERLLKAGVLIEKNGRILKPRKKLQRENVTSRPEIRRYLMKTLNLAETELTRTDAESFRLRHVVGMSIAVNPAHFPEAERRIAAFHQELADLLTDGECTQLYQLGFQLFPVFRGK